ncbi:hypothetical protein ATER59S_01681 [Aquamicrobium terrae]
MPEIDNRTVVEAIIAHRVTFVDAGSGRNLNGLVRRAFSAALPACQGDRDAAASRALDEALAKVRGVAS